MDLKRGDSVMMFVPSIASVIGAGIMMISYLSSRTLRKKESAEIVFYIGVSNFLTSLGSMMGEPVDRSAACWFEAIGTNIFSLSSMTWNVVLTYMLLMIVAGRGFKLTWMIHVCAWGLPVIVTLLPFINATYGAPDGLGWCFVVPTRSTPTWGLLFWYWFSYYVWLWGSVGIIGIMLLMTKFISRGHKESSQKVLWKAIWKLQLYPLLIVICWSVPAFTDTVLATPGIAINSIVLSNLSLILPCSQGFLTCFVYWYQFDEARNIFLVSIGCKVSNTSTGTGSPHDSSMSTRQRPKNSSQGSGAESGDENRVFVKVSQKRSVNHSKVAVDLVSEEVV